MTTSREYREAAARAQESKARLLSSVEAAKLRVAPARLIADAKAGVVSSIMDIPAYALAKVRQRPVAIGAAGSAFVLYLNRRPLKALLGRLYVRWKNRNSETDDD